MHDSRITLFQRKPLKSQFSVERLFQDIIRAFPHDISCSTTTSRFESRGIFSRAYNIAEAFFRQGDVNHITGDVHFLSYLLSKNKTLLTILDCGSLERLKGLRKAIFYFFWYWLPVKRVSMITVISESTKSELMRYVNCDQSKIRVIPCCISEKFKPVPKEFNRALPVFLQIGTAGNKNLLTVAEALFGIPCHYRIIGKLSAEQTSKLDACKLDYSNAYNLSDTDIIGEYVKCDVLIFVSTYEGFGLPIIEANATGRPVITSNILSMPEVAGNAACLVNPLDVHDIRKGVLRLLQDESYRNTLISNGYANAQRFKPGIIARQYFDLYREIIRRNSAK